MTGTINPPKASAANETAMRLLKPPAHGPIPIPGAFGPRNRGLVPADQPLPARPAAPALHDRAQAERELEGGGARRSRTREAPRGLVGRLFERLFRS